MHKEFEIDSPFRHNPLPKWRKSVFEQAAEVADLAWATDPITLNNGLELIKQVSNLLCDFNSEKIRLDGTIVGRNDKENSEYIFISQPSKVNPSFNRFGSFGFKVYLDENEVTQSVLQIDEINRTYFYLRDNITKEVNGVMSKVNSKDWEVIIKHLFLLESLFSREIFKAKVNFL